MRANAEESGVSLQLTYVKTALFHSNGQSAVLIETLRRQENAELRDLE